MAPGHTDGRGCDRDDLVAVQRLLAWYFAGERAAAADAERGDERA